MAAPDPANSLCVIGDNCPHRIQRLVRQVDAEKPLGWLGGWVAGCLGWLGCLVGGPDGLLGGQLGGWVAAVCMYIYMQSKNK